MRFRRIAKLFCQCANLGRAHADNAVGVDRRQELAMKLLVLEVLKEKSRMRTFWTAMSWKVLSSTAAS